MRKIFFFFAAMLVAITVNATTWNITNSDEGNLRRCLRDNAQAGDTVVLADGEYAENQSYNVKKDVVIMAADGAKPVINQKSYLNLYASAKIIGIKFKYVGTSDGYCIYFRENSKKYLALEGCEFQDFTNYAFTSWDKFHIDSCIVNNCYFHDFAKGAFYFPKSTLANDTNACDKLKVTNSTFANITLNEVAVLDLRNNNNSTAATSELTVDHCTFYKCRGYERMIQTYKTPKGSVTNCIMMNPLDADTVSPTYATYLYGGEVKNCLTYQTKGHRDWDTHPTITDCSVANPLFVDAANGDFTLGDNSPALAAGTNKSDLGDPRWAKPKTLYCYVDKGWWTDGSAAVNCYAKKEGVAELAVWPGVAMTEVETNLWKIELSRKFDKINFVRVNPADKSDYWGAKTAEMNVPTNSNLFTITSNDAQWDSESKTAAGTWSIKDAKFYIAGSMTDWDNGKIGSLADSYTLSLAAGKHQLKVVDLSGNWLGMGAMTDIAGGLYPDASAAICLQLADAADVVVTFVKDGEDIETYTVTGNFSAPSVALAGEMTTWTAADLATYNFTPAIDKKSASWQYTPTALPASDNNYAFKVVFDGDQWLSNNGYWITRENHSVSALGATGEGENLIFRPDVLNKAYTFTWTYATGTLDVTFPADTPSAIDNTAADGQTVKFIQNGMLFIQKNGTIYNVLGEVVK